MIARSRTRTAARRALGGLVVLLAAAGLTLPEPRAPAAPAKDPPPKTMTVTGTCLDEADKPLAGVTVALYREDYKAQKHEKLAERETAADGGFAFRDAPALSDDRGLAVVVTKAGRGSLIQRLFAGLLREPLQFRLRPADTLSGRVTDEAGKPVAGARVWAMGLITGPLDGIGTAVTDADGKYAIKDMGRWTDEDARPKPIGGGRMIVGGGVFFDVRHPDFAHERPTWNRIPATVNVVLSPGGVIEGKVTDQVTGKPAAGAAVSLQGTKGLPAGGSARTDADGKYQMRGLKAGQYNLYADAPDRACTAIDSLTVTAGQTLAGQDLTLIGGGWIEGRVVDAETGEPVPGTADHPIQVGCYGPGRPKSGAAVQSARVDEKGRFRLRVAPGTNYPYIMSRIPGDRVADRTAYETGVEVKAGETTQVDFPVRPAKP